MAQTVTHSAIESMLNNGIGFVLSMASWPLVSFITGVHVNLVQNFEITVLFTVIVTVKQFVIRRLFAKIESK